MQHDISLITTIAAALGLGLVFGMLAVRLRLPALVGYLAAGVLIGPPRRASSPTCTSRRSWPRSA